MTIPTSRRPIRFGVHMVPALPSSFSRERSASAACAALAERSRLNDALYQRLPVPLAAQHQFDDLPDRAGAAPLLGDVMRRGPRLGATVGDGDGQPAVSQRRQVGQVVADVADRSGSHSPSRPAVADRPASLSVAPWNTNSMPSSRRPHLHHRRAAARDETGALADALPHPQARSRRGRGSCFISSPPVP